MIAHLAPHDLASIGLYWRIFRGLSMYSHLKGVLDVLVDLPKETSTKRHWGRYVTGGDWV
jgi:hypothetical protein